MKLELTEGLTIYHQIAAILGIILFLTALALFIRAAVKTNTYPKPLIACLVIGGMLEVFPVTGKFEAIGIVDKINTLTDELKHEPTNAAKKREFEARKKELQKNIQKVERWDYKSPATKLKLNRARELLRRKP